MSPIVRIFSNSVAAPPPVSINMPTITGYSGGAATDVGGFTSTSFIGYAGTKLTDTKYIGIAVPSERSTSDVYAHGIDWSGTTPTVNNLSVVDTNGFQFTGRVAGLAIAKLNNDKAVSFYQQGSTTVRIQVLSFAGGTNSVVVEASTTDTSSGGFSTGQATYIASDGNDHYVALASCNPGTGNYDSYIKIYRVNSSTNTVTYITQGQIAAGADNNAKVTSFGEVSSNTYGLLGLSLRNTGYSGNLAYATMKFNISTESLTVSSNLNTLNSGACILPYCTKIGININTNKIMFTYDPNSGGIRCRQATISYDGTTTTIENDTNDGTLINHFLGHYFVNGYDTPEYQAIHVCRDLSVNQSWRVETLVFDNSTNQYTRQNDKHPIIAPTSVFPGGSGMVLFLKDPDNAMLVWANRDADKVQYSTFNITN